MNKKKFVMDENKQKQLNRAVDEIDYGAVIARLAGKPLSDEQKAACKMFDDVYDATHPSGTEEN